jgi:hypothetical protein
MDVGEASRFSRVQFFRRAHCSTTKPGMSGTRDCVPVSIAFSLHAHGRAPKWVFGSALVFQSLDALRQKPLLNSRPVDASAYASPGCLAAPGARLEAPFLWVSFIPDSPPVYTIDCAR